MTYKSLQYNNIHKTTILRRCRYSFTTRSRCGRIAYSHTLNINPNHQEEIMTQEQIKEAKKQRKLEAKKKRRKITISFSPHRVNISYSKFSTKELITARDLLNLAIEQRSSHPINPLKPLLREAIKQPRRKNHPLEDQMVKGRMVQPKKAITYKNGQRIAKKKKVAKKKK